MYEIARIHGQAQFLVKLQAGGESGEKTWVRRSQLRSTSVPWEEELAAASEYFNELAAGVRASEASAVKPKPGMLGGGVR